MNQPEYNPVVAKDVTGSIGLLRMVKMVPGSEDLAAVLFDQRVIDRNGHRTTFDQKLNDEAQEPQPNFKCVPAIAIEEPMHIGEMSLNVKEPERFGQRSLAPSQNDRANNGLEVPKRG